MELAQVNKYKHEELVQWVHAPVFKSEEKVSAVSEIYDSLNVREIALQEIENYFAKGMDCLTRIAANDQKKTELKQFVTGLLVREI